MVQSLLDISKKEVVNSHAWLYNRRQLEKLPHNLANELLMAIQSKWGAEFNSIHLEHFRNCASEVSLDASKLPQLGPDYLAALSDFSGLIGVDIRNAKRLKDKHILKLQKHAQQLTYLTLCRLPQLSGAILDTFIGQCVNLRTLDLTGINLARKNGKCSLIALCHSKSLQSLTLDYMGLSDSDIYPLSQLTNLKSLSLATNPVSENCINVLLNLDKLTELDVSWTEMRVVPGLTGLKKLCMNKCDLMEIGDGGDGPCGLESLIMRQAEISKVPRKVLEVLRFSWETLKQIDLSGTGLTCFQKNRLSFPTGGGCTCLDLSNTKISNRDMQFISTMTELRMLKLNGLRILESGFEFIGRLPKLQELHMEECVLDGVSITHCANLPSLLHLNLHGSTLRPSSTPNIHPPPIQVQHNVLRFDNLNMNSDDMEMSLALERIAGSEQGNLNSGDCLCSMDNLEFLDLFNVKWDGCSVGEVGKYCGGLKRLAVSCKEEDDLHEFAQLGNLEEFKLKVWILSDIGLEHLCKLTSLKQLDLITDWKELTNKDTLQKLYDNLPDLSNLIVNGETVDNVNNPPSQSSVLEQARGVGTGWTDDRRKYSMQCLVNIRQRLVSAYRSGSESELNAVNVVRCAVEGPVLVRDVNSQCSGQMECRDSETW